MFGNRPFLPISKYVFLEGEIAKLSERVGESLGERAGASLSSDFDEY
jgi:hypothetical protein